ncbi:MAG TPA: glycosyltransferase family 39 protein [Vicinamibacterales bacterium]|nr:glycosyltransferase family 39 protein [Vicinamibacterales bacterium]
MKLPPDLTVRESLDHRYRFAVLVLILLASVSIRLYDLSGYIGLDDAEYARFASRLAHGEPFPAAYSGPAVFPLRVGVFGPPALLFRLFGVSEWTMILYPLALSIAGIVLVYACASLYFGARAGLIAAAILGGYHWDVESSTKLLPDLPAACLALAGVTLVAWIDHLGTENRRRLLGGGLLAGISFGFSWLCKETVAYLVPFCLVLLVLMYRRHGRAVLLLWAGVAIGALSILGAETLSYYAATGDPLFRFHETERNYRQWQNGFFTEGSDFGWSPGTTRAQALLDRLFISGPRVILFDRSLYFLPFFGLVAVLYGWLRRDRAFLVPGVWLGSLVLMFNFASSSLESYVPLAIFHRYLYPLFYPSVIVVAGFIAVTLFAPWQLRAPRLAGAVCVLAMLSAGMPHLYYGATSRSAWMAEARVWRHEVRPETVVYADALTLRAFEFYAGYPNATRWTAFEQLASTGDFAAGSLVVVNRRYIEWLDRNAGMWLTWPLPGPTDPSGYRSHPFYTDPPRSWTTVWQNADVRVYRVGLASAAMPVAAEGTLR